MKIETDTEFKTVADDLAAMSAAQTKQAAQLELELQAVRDKHAPALSAMKDAIKDKAKALCTYLKKKGVADRLFKDGQRQGETIKAIFGFRDSPEALATLNTKEKEADLAKRLYDEGKTKYLQLGAPSIDKDAIKKDNLTDEQLAAIGLRRTVKTSFYCELKDKETTGRVTSKA